MAKRLSPVALALLLCACRESPPQPAASAAAEAPAEAHAEAPATAPADPPPLPANASPLVRTLHGLGECEALRTDDGATVHLVATCPTLMATLIFSREPLTDDRAETHVVDFIGELQRANPVVSRESLLVAGAPVATARLLSNAESARAFEAYFIAFEGSGGHRILSCAQQGTTAGVCRDVVLAAATHPSSSPIEAARALGLRFGEPTRLVAAPPSAVNAPPLPL